MYVYIFLYLFMSLFGSRSTGPGIRSFNCESRACYVGNPRESFFRLRERFFRESFAKVGYYE